MKITCNRKSGVYASTGSVDNMINAFQNRIAELQMEDNDLAAATDLDTCGDMPIDECEQEPIMSAEDHDHSQCVNDILQVLADHGYDVSSQEAQMEADAAADYMDQMYESGTDYSPEQWYEDTVANYPEDLEDIPML